MDELTERILQLKAEKDAVILAHYYVPGSVQDIADFIGDSYYLSKIAAQVTEKVIVFCGVAFMGESAKMLNPDKVVLMPDLQADCPMAHMVKIRDIQKIRETYEDVAVVCYINSTAEIKGYADVIVTSSNAKNVIAALPNHYIYFIPDEHLGRYISRQLPEKTFLFNDGYCPVHTSIRVSDVLKMKRELPQAEILAHPECKEDILDLADFVGSTSDLVAYTETSSSQDFIICTEIGVIHEMEKRSLGKSFHAPSVGQVCPDMKLNTVEKIIYALETFEPAVEMDESLRTKGLQPLERMLELAEVKTHAQL